MSGNEASPQRPKRQRQKLGQWFVLAALIHAELLLIFGLTAYFYAPREAELSAQLGGQGESIEIGSLDEETSRKIVAEQEREEKRLAEEEKKKEEEERQAPGQVVDLAKPREEKRPDKARFASEYDSSVEKETKKYGKFDQKARQSNAQGTAEESRPAVPAAPPANPSAGAAKPTMLAMRIPGAAGRPRGPERMAREGDSDLPGAGTESLQAPSDLQGTFALGGQSTPQRVGGGGTPQESSASAASQALVPSEEQLARAIGSGTQDYLKDLDEGQETTLNAKKWKFASFFNRVKEQVREHWKPAEVYQRRDPTGSIYGGRDRYTLLRVQLKPDGSLANVKLETPSGVEFLDDEAIEAFKLAQPFPNPPRQLVEDTSGMINFRFGFYFELSGAPRMKVFRYNNM